MDEIQNPQSSTPEFIQQKPGDVTPGNDKANQNNEIPQSVQQQSPPQNTYSVNQYQQQNPNPQPNSYYSHAPVRAPGQYPQNNVQPQRQYQPQNNYPPQSNFHPQYPEAPYYYQPQYRPYANPSVSGKATASLVLGIVALVFAWLSVFAVISLPCSIIGLVLGISARKELLPEQGRGTATAGMICSIIALVLAVVMLVILTFVLVTAVSYSTTFGPTFGV